MCHGVSGDEHQQYTWNEISSKKSSLVEPLYFLVPFSMGRKLIKYKFCQTQRQRSDKTIEKTYAKRFRYQNFRRVREQCNYSAHKQQNKQRRRKRRKMFLLIVYQAPSEQQLLLFELVLTAAKSVLSWEKLKFHHWKLKQKKNLNCWLQWQQLLLWSKRLLTKEHETQFNGIFIWNDWRTVLQKFTKQW